MKNTETMNYFRKPNLMTGAVQLALVLSFSLGATVREVKATEAVGMMLSISQDMSQIAGKESFTSEELTSVAESAEKVAEKLDQEHQGMSADAYAEKTEKNRSHSLFNASLKLVSKKQARAMVQWLSTASQASVGGISHQVQQVVAQSELSDRAKLKAIRANIQNDQVMAGIKTQIRQHGSVSQYLRHLANEIRALQKNVAADAKKAQADDTTVRLGLTLPLFIASIVLMSLGPAVVGVVWYTIAKVFFWVTILPVIIFVVLLVIALIAALSLVPTPRTLERMQKNLDQWTFSPVLIS